MEKARELFETNSKEYCDGPLKFAICMATYRRPNGKSPYYLERSLTCLKNQTATNWHLFLVGDKYESQEEFDSACKLLPESKLTALNLPIAPERENISDSMNRWKVAGANAFNHAHSLALEKGYDYILHLDDDDVFHEKKIQLLNYTISLFDAPPSYIFHFADYIKNMVLPMHNIPNTLSPNNLIPKPTDCIHSSYCIHKSLLKDFSFSGYEPGKIHYLEGDIQFLNFLHSYLQKTPGSFSLFLPFKLCEHKVEREF